VPRQDLSWGTDGGSFCSNPACHGRKWPEMNLDSRALRPRGGLEARSTRDAGEAPSETEQGQKLRRATSRGRRKKAGVCRLFSRSGNELTLTISILTERLDVVRLSS
jgi:hypothetical protein